MRRITLAMVSTIAGLVLLFSYRTSTSGPAGGSTTAPVGIVGPAAPGTPDPTDTSATSPGPGGSPTTAPGSGTLTVNGSAVDNGARIGWKRSWTVTAMGTIRSVEVAIALMCGRPTPSTPVR